MSRHRPRDSDWQVPRPSPQPADEPVLAARSRDRSSDPKSGLRDPRLRKTRTPAMPAVSRQETRRFVKWNWPAAETGSSPGAPPHAAAAGPRADRHEPQADSAPAPEMTRSEMGGPLRFSFSVSPAAWSPGEFAGSVVWPKPGKSNVNLQTEFRRRQSDPCPNGLL